MILSVFLPTQSGLFEGKTKKITRCLMCMVEGRDVHNLPMGVVVN